ncbi:MULTISPECIES: hypothetical protein [unclassified Butyrivibrio]|uniref:hypothetical protein n=2 Tax=Butyrivibrio TaxID=830 RepID=UPI0003B4B52F|nr:MULTISPECIES: hypothetical protein [unclassified Butyrivibrio]SDB07229.1 hypothetical protein SAMN02910263_00285 [Butyrivibrio sp. INlla16]SEL89910.1 hypothetical protein SAMN04487770_12038 [Butyrivibrio sp. ob235]
MIPVPFMASIALMSVIFDAIIVIAELLFFLVLVRFLFFSGDFRQFSIFAKIIEIIFVIMVLLILVALFLTMARFE